MYTGQTYHNALLSRGPSGCDPSGKSSSLYMTCLRKAAWE